MRVYEAILRALQFFRADAAFGSAGENAASQLSVEHSTEIKPVVVAGMIADVLRRHKPVIIFVGFGGIPIKDRRPVPQLPRTKRDPATFVQRVYPLANILTTAWGVSHA